MDGHFVFMASLIITPTGIINEDNPFARETDEGKQKKMTFALTVVMEQVPIKC